MAPPADVSRFFRSFRTPLFIASSSASTAQAERSSVQILTGIAAVLALRIVEPLRLSASFVRRGIVGVCVPQDRFAWDAVPIHRRTDPRLWAAVRSKRAACQGSRGLISRRSEFAATLPSLSVTCARLRCMAFRPMAAVAAQNPAAAPIFPLALCANSARNKIAAAFGSSALLRPCALLALRFGRCLRGHHGQSSQPGQPPQRWRTR